MVPHGYVCSTLSVEGPLDFGWILEHTVCYILYWSLTDELRIFGTDIYFWWQVPQVQTKPKLPNPHGLWVIIPSVQGSQYGRTQTTGVKRTQPTVVRTWIQVFRESVRSWKRSLFSLLAIIVWSYTYRLSTFPYIVTSMMDHSDDSSDAKNIVYHSSHWINQIWSRVTWIKL